MQFRYGIPLNPVGSIRDTILTKVLMNERHCNVISAYLNLIKENSKPEKISDSFKEFFYRTFSREFEYYTERAKNVVRLYKDLDEAKKFMKE